MWGVMVNTQKIHALVIPRMERKGKVGGIWRSGAAAAAPGGRSGNDPLAKDGDKEKRKGEY